MPRGKINKNYPRHIVGNRKSRGKKNNKVAKPSARFERNIVLHNMNRSPMAFSRKMKFNYEFNFYLNTVLGQQNDTQMFDLQSPWDPDLSNNTRNASTSYWNTFMGATSGKYEKFLVDYAVVEIECIAWTTSDLINVVFSLSNKGAADYPNTQGTAVIGQRPMATTGFTMKAGGKQIRKKIVCVPYKIHGIKKSDYTQKITTPNVAGIDGADTGYFSEHNSVSRNSSWLAITAGPQPNNTTSPISYPISQCRFQGRITYYGTAYKPILLQTTA